MSGVNSLARTIDFTMAIDVFSASPIPTHIPDLITRDLIDPSCDMAKRNSLFTIRGITETGSFGEGTTDWMERK